MVSRRRVHRCFNSLSSTLSITREQWQWTPLTESVQSSAPWLSSSGIPFRRCPPCNVPNVFRHPGHRERLCIWYEAWQKCHLQSQTCPNQFCFQCELCVRQLAGSSFMGKWRYLQWNFISEANFYFVSFCPCLELSLRPKYSQYERQTPNFFCLKF